MMLAVLLVLTSCGQQSDASVGDRISGSSAPKDVTTESSVAATPDIGLLPVSDYTLSDCSPTSARPPGSTTIDAAPFQDVEALRRAVDSVFSARIEAVGKAVTVTPSGLSKEAVQATGAASAEQLSWTGVPVTMEVERGMVGKDLTGSRVTVFVLGCFTEGAIPITTVGTEVLVFANQDADGVGPDKLYGGTHRAVDYLYSPDGGALRAGPNALGLGSQVPFFVGRTIEDVAKALTARE